MLELLQTIALLCQLGTGSRSFYDTSEIQSKCHQALLKCSGTGLTMEMDLAKCVEKGVHKL